MFPMISPNLREHLLELLNVHDIIVIRVLSILPKLKEYLLELLYVQDIPVARPLVSTLVICDLYKLIKLLLVLNARSIVKPDAFPALCADSKCNNIGVCCISETWLKPTIPNSLICPPNFSIIRKDRADRRGDGVAILCRNDWRMQSVRDLDNPFECLWTKIITQNSEYFVATIYHPPDYEYNELDLIEFLIDSYEQLMLSKPDSKIILAGDVNNLNIRSVLNQLSFTQLVNVPTRGQKILDVFITNAPNYWKHVKVVKSLVRSDHDMVITYPRDIVKQKEQIPILEM